MNWNQVVRQQLMSGFALIEKSLADLSPEEAVQRPHGLTPIVWQVGHLALTDARITKQLSGGDLLVPEDYEKLFARGTSGEGSFPPLSSVLEAFRRVQEKLLQLAEEDLARPAEGGPFYSTVGEALLFLDKHRWYHIGKIMTLRGLLNKPQLL